MLILNLFSLFARIVSNVLHLLECLGDELGIVSQILRFGDLLNYILVHIPRVQEEPYSKEKVP